MRISEPAEYAILGLLHSHPMHGYEMFQQFENGTLGQIVHLEMSQMYAFLKKLERLQYIEAHLEKQGPRPPRKVFHITTLGRNTFFQWLAEPVVRPREIRLLFLIKLYFVQRFLPKNTAQLIDQQIVACQNFLAHLKSLQQATQGEVGSSFSPLPRKVSPPISQQDDDDFFNHVVLRARIYQTRSLRDWLRELQKEWADFLPLPIDIL